MPESEMMWDLRLYLEEKILNAITETQIETNEKDDNISE
jgi:hypothetical protein